jgi:hypothetical protein
VAGAAGLVFTFIPFVVYIAWALAILGIAFAGVSFGRIRRGTERGRGMAIAGMILGIVALVIWLIVFLLIAVLFHSVTSLLSAGAIALV